MSDKEEKRAITEVEAQRALTFVSNANAKLKAEGKNEWWTFLWNGDYIEVNLVDVTDVKEIVYATTYAGYRELIERLKNDR